MGNPTQSNGCTHRWVCVCADRNDALYRCACCNLYGDGYGCTWIPGKAAILVAPQGEVKS